MPPKKREAPVIVRWLVQNNVAFMYWLEFDPGDAFGTKTIAYGWSDGLVTWTDTRP